METGDQRSQQDQRKVAVIEQDWRWWTEWDLKPAFRGNAISGDFRKVEVGQRKMDVTPQVRNLRPGIREVAEKENDSRNGKSEPSSGNRGSGSSR